MNEMECSLAKGHRHIKANSIEKTRQILDACREQLIFLSERLKYADNETLEDLEALGQKCRCLETRIHIVQAQLPKTKPASPPPIVLSCRKKNNEDPKNGKRPYLEFAKAGVSFKAADNSNPCKIEELRKLLERLGLNKSLGAQILNDGGVQEIYFPHRRIEIERLVEHYTELKPYLEMVDEKSSKGLTSCGTSTEKRNTALSEDLRSAALRSLKSAPYPAPVTCTLKQAESYSEEELLVDIYKDKGFKGLCLGETHDHEMPKLFLISNMELLKNLGVTTIFWETFPYDTMQPYLDAFFASSTDEMHPILEAYLKTFDSNDNACPRNLRRELLLKAKNHGIRVVGIDTSAAKDFTSFSTLDDSFTRVLKMNHVAEQIMRHEMGSGKFIALMGCAHASSANFLNTVVSGLADRFQCPFIDIKNSTTGEAEIWTNTPHLGNLPVAPLEQHSFEAFAHICLRKPH